MQKGDSKYNGDIKKKVRKKELKKEGKKQNMTLIKKS